MLLLPQARHSKLPIKQKEPSFKKIAPLEALVDMEGWKVSMLKGMYVARMPILIQGIWLKESRFTYVTKKFMILVVFIETKMQINQVGVVFNNLPNRLHDLGNSHKSDIIKNVEFKGTQILDIMLWKWFSVNSSFLAPDLKEHQQKSVILQPTNLRLVATI